MYELLQEFHNVVNHEVNLRKQGSSKLTYCPYQQSPSEWRLEWVNVFSELCEPLYNFLSLPEMSKPVPVEWNKFLSTEDRIAILNSFEQFFMGTAMNHLLDQDLCTFLIADCVLSLTRLVEGIVGDDIRNSFQFQRVGQHRHIMTHIMVNNGFWQGNVLERDKYLKAIRETPFPSEKYFGMSGWERVG